MYQRLPDMDRRLADDIDSILAGEIESCEDTVAALLPKYLHQSFPRRFGEGGLFGFFVFLDLGLSTDARHLE